MFQGLDLSASIKFEANLVTSLGQGLLILILDLKYGAPTVLYGFS